MIQEILFNGRFDSRGDFFQQFDTRGHLWALESWAIWEHYHLQCDHPRSENDVF